MSAPDADTIAAISTPPGRGGVAVVRVSGPSAFVVATALTGRAVDATLAGRFFHAKLRRGEAVLDDGLVLVFAAPRSYTGEDAVEFHTHGGSVAPRRVLEAALESGARLARRGEFTARAFLNGKLDLSAAEAVIDLIDAKSVRAADDALKRLNGASRRDFERLYEQALAISADLEHALDFSEDELSDVFFDDVRARLARLDAAVESVASTAREGRILREGASVVLAGSPNVGKSSLMNALLRENRAIVSDVAGTTRDSIEEWLEIEGWPVRLVDTAGLRVATDAVEAEGVARAEELMRGADVVLALSDGVAAFPEMPPEKTVRVRSKCDAVGADAAADVSVSAHTGEGLARLRTILAAKLSEIGAASGEGAEADVSVRQRAELRRASDAVGRARAQMDSGDVLLAANEMRSCADIVGGLVGRTYSADLLEAVFSRFCVGK